MTKNGGENTENRFNTLFHTEASKLGPTTEGYSKRLGTIPIRGISINTQNEGGNTPIHVAILCNNYNFLVWAVKQKNVDLNIENDMGNTPLFMALAAPDKRYVDILLNHGADPNIPADSKGNTPLHIAVLQQEHDSVNLLLERPNTNANLRNTNGLAPMEVAIMQNDLKSIELLLVLGKKKIDLNSLGEKNLSTIHFASVNGTKEALKLLLEKGKGDIKINAQEKDGRTALYLTVLANMADHMEILLKHGADANIPDQNKRTPLHILSFVGGGEALLQLLTLGKGAININAQEKDGCTALHTAILKHGSFESQIDALCEFIASNALNPDQKQKACNAINNVFKLKFTPTDFNQSIASQKLIMSASKKYLKEINKFSKFITDISNETSVLGSNHPLKTYQNPVDKFNFIEILLKNGANPNIADNEGNTALHLSVERGYYAITHLLLDHKADTQVVNKQGKTSFNLVANQFFSFTEHEKNQTRYWVQHYAEKMNGSTPYNNTSPPKTAPSQSLANAPKLPLKKDNNGWIEHIKKTPEKTSEPTTDYLQLGEKTGMDGRYLFY